MRKALKTTIAFLLIAVLLISTSITSFAATNDTTTQTRSAISRIVFDGSGSDYLRINTSYQTIAHVDSSYSTGFNAEIVILVINNTDISANDIKLLDKNGNWLWEEQPAIPREGIRSFELGPDVYEIQIKTQSGEGWAYAGFVRDL